MLRQTFTPAPAVKLLVNIGACLDIVTGTFVKGKYGENILLGGLGSTTGVVGGGNKFKSTVVHFMSLSAMSRLITTTETSMSTYDTEVNIHEFKLKAMAEAFQIFKDRDIINDGTWVITDKTVYYGDQWFEKLKEYLKYKIDNSKKYLVETPFLDRDGVSLMKALPITVSEVDSLSEFETSDVAKIQDDNLLGESGGNTIHMRQGLSKTRLLMEIPHLSGSANHFFLFTAHLGKDMQIASGPYQQAPEKKLQHMKMGDKIKGVTDKFFFLLSNCWSAVSATPLVNQGTKAPEYPKDSEENQDSGSLDLNIVTLKQLRSKSGPSGITVDLVVSQSEGVLASLTEFHYIKDCDRFGLSGTLQSYSLDIYPDVKLSRTTVRGKLKEDAKLERAMNITSELCQMHQYHYSQKPILCTAKELYDGIKEKGYDWDFILEHTRGWWTFNNDDHPTKYFLSTKDLLLMRLGVYHPYWMESDCKTIKKEFQKSN